MAIRIVGVDLPQNKRGEIALTYIYGIGRSSSAKILDKAGIDRDIKVKDWTDDQAAKIREIITYQPVTPVPNSHPSIEGIFMPRDVMITAIDLGGCLQIGPANSNGFFVVAQVDDTEVAFHIDSVVGIHKVEKEEIRDMGHFVPKDGYTDGAIRINKKLVILLNFENIVRDVNPEELTMQLEEDKIKEVFDE